MYTVETKKIPVYLFDQITGELKKRIESDDGFRHPDFRGYSLLPENATRERPAKRPGYVAVRRRAKSDEPWHYENDRWELIPDFRGKAFYDPKTNKVYKITQLGEQPQPGWAEIPAA